MDYLELAYVEDTILAPQATVNAMGIGINLGNTLDAPLEGDWAPAAQRQFLEDFANASFNHVRIPVTWDKHTATTAPYSVDTAFMDRVELVVDWALAEGSYVVLNAHHESWLKEDADNAALQERFDSIWRQVAERFKNKSSRLIFEILNEPHGMTQSQSDETNNRILEIIRQTNPTRLVIFAGNDYSSADRLLVADIPNDEYVIGNFHSYDPWPFAGQCTRRWGSEADIAELRGIYDQVKSWSEENGVAVMVNEFGSAKYDFTLPDNKCVQADRLLYLQTHASLAIAGAAVLSVGLVAPASAHTDSLFTVQVTTEGDAADWTLLLTPIVGVVVLHQIAVDLLGHCGAHFDRTLFGRDRLAGEISLRRLPRTRRQGFGNLLLQARNEILVAFARHHGQHVDVVHNSRMVHTVPMLVDAQAQSATHFLAPRNSVVAVLEHAHDEDVRIVPPLA